MVFTLNTPHTKYEVARSGDAKHRTPVLLLSFLMPVILARASLVGCVESNSPSLVLGSCTDQEEEEDNTAAIAPGLAPKMSAAKAAKSAAEKDARIAVSYSGCLVVHTPIKFFVSFF